MTQAVMRHGSRVAAVRITSATRPARAASSPTPWVTLWATSSPTVHARDWLIASSVTRGARAGQLYRG